MKHLTDREKKILELIGQGLSSGQIAYVLHISAHTVDSHRKNLLLKFEAKNSAELVRKSLQRDNNKDLS
jgi:DNA-binding CsgD family transcriptional regulator